MIDTLNKFWSLQCENLSRELDGEQVRYENNNIIKGTKQRTLHGLL